MNGLAQMNEQNSIVLIISPTKLLTNRTATYFAEIVCSFNDTVADQSNLNIRNDKENSSDIACT